MPANELLAEMHNAKQRMPLILPPEGGDIWLNGTPEHATALLVPYPSELMRAPRVSKRVNAPRNDDPELMVPVELETAQQPLQLNLPVHRGSRADSREFGFPVRQIAAPPADDRVVSPIAQRVRSWAT